MKKIKIEQVELGYAQEAETHHRAILQKLGYSIPDGFRLRVELEQANGRKKRSSAGASTWAPESEPMKVWLEPIPAETSKADMETAQPAESSSPANAFVLETSQSPESADVQVHPAEIALLKALDRAESTPGWNFVSLKKFRDEILPQEDVQFLRSDAQRQNALRWAIDQRLILTKPVPNPKSPQFPVTSIRLNRLMPRVQEALGQARSTLDFHPIRIKGEPLSATILHERR
jgi:hypothetical protein